MRRARRLGTVGQIHEECYRALQDKLEAKLKEQRERRSESLAKKRALRQASVASKEAAPAKK